MGYVERFTAVHQRVNASLPPAQDVMTMGFHYMKRADLEATGTPVTDSAMRTAVQARWDTFETAWKPHRASWVTLSEYVHADAFPSGSPPHPAVLRTSKSSAGTAGAGGHLPPQIAISCSLETYNRRHWGRFYLGGLQSGPTLDTVGMLTTTARDTINTALAVMLNGLLTDGVAPVVITRPTWSDAAHTTITRAMTIWPIIGCRVDTIFDVVRRRRWEHALSTHRAESDLTVPTANPTVYNASHVRSTP